MELLDIVDENGVPTGAVIDREIAHARGVLHRTAHVWIFRKRDGRVQVLLQKRSVGKDSYPGCYDISSAGHIPAGVDFVPSALRELEEELGVTAQPEALVLCGNRRFRDEGVFHGRPFRDNQYSRVFALWLDREAADFALQKEEVSAVRWFDFEEAVRGVRENAFRHCIFEEELEILARAVL